VHACCTDAGDAVCGLQTGDLGTPITGCLQRDRKGKTPSTHCGDFWDQVDMNANGHFDNPGKPPLQFAPCCTPEGLCGAVLSQAYSDGKALPGIDLHLGCISYTDLQKLMAASDAGVGADAGMSDPNAALKMPILPFCDAETGGNVTSGTIPGVPAIVCGCGEGVPYDEQKLPCLSDLPADVCGAEPIDKDALASFPSTCVAARALRTMGFRVCPTCPPVRVANSRRPRPPRACQR